jgi:hypothetical protein
MPTRSGSVILQLRLNERVHARYASEAAALGKPLATYLRERLEREDALQERLAIIEQAVTELAATRAVLAPTTSSESPAALEQLLILRQLAGPKAELARKELQRRHIEPWS